METTVRVLIAEDDAGVRLSTGLRLREAGYEVIECPDGLAASEALAEHNVDIVVTDVGMPRMNGIELFARIRTQHPTVDTIVITSLTETDLAVDFMRRGAADYLTKPLDVPRLLGRLERVATQRAIAAELTEARVRLAELDRAQLIGESPEFRALLDRLATFAPSSAPVMILGETGTGKERVARVLHAMSQRRGAFVPVHCAALPAQLIESELFGHVRGAFTGAHRERAGRFRRADGGTLFLDEVAEIPLDAQPKLLRVLQDGVFEAVGSDEPLTADVRLVCATHRDLRAMVQRGEFREDLYFRLNVLGVRVPALRERTGDIALLVQHFVGEFGGPEMSVSAEAWARLRDYAFPGNVRELEHAIRYACVVARQGQIRGRDLPDELSDGVAPAAETAMIPLADALQRAEVAHIQRALEATGGHKSRAADLLGISRKVLWERMRRYKI